MTFDRTRGVRKNANIMVKTLTYEPGSIRYNYWAVQYGQAEIVEGGIIEETLLTVFVNGQDLATLMCSPIGQEALALGFLYNEEVIESLDEVGLVRANSNRTSVDVFLRHSHVKPTRRMVLTSGCGGGITLQHLAETHPPLQTDFALSPQVILDRMRELNTCAQLYQQVRGVHTSVLADAEQVLLCAEDIGRHNTIDKVAGQALLEGIETRDRILISSGRISSEMLGKARRMGVPIVASRTAPTSITLELARVWQICVVGYVRQGGMRVYTHPQRLGLKH
jgi:FdhD protein